MPVYQTLNMRNYGPPERRVWVSAGGIIDLGHEEFLTLYVDRVDDHYVPRLELDDAPPVDFILEQRDSLLDLKHLADLLIVPRAIRIEKGRPVAVYLELQKRSLLKIAKS